MQALYVLLSVLMSGAVGDVFAKADLLLVPLPADSRTELITDAIQQNGTQLKISKFYSDESLENVIGFYKSLWHVEGEMPGYILNSFDQWELVSKLTENHNVVLQLRSINQNKSEGYLSIATLNSNRRQAKTEFPQQDGTETFSTSNTDSDGRAVETQVLLTPQSVSETVNFYKSKMYNLGWSLNRASSLNGTELLVFNRSTDLCELAISRLNHASTVIFLNRVKRRG